MDAVFDTLGRVVADVWGSVQHNWPFLLASVVVASVVQVYLGTDRLAGWLRRRVWVAVLGAVALASLTPFCSCGTTAVVLGAMASAVPWAPLVAFMVSSPLTSPSEYVLSAGLFGGAFATTFFVGTIAIGLGSGVVAHAAERLGLLAGQARLQAPTTVRAGATRTAAGPVAPPAGVVVGTAPAIESRTALALADPAEAATCGCGDSTGLSGGGCGSGCAASPASLPRRVLLVRALAANARRLALYFLGFAALGYLLIEVVPTQVLTDHLGGDSPLAVPLAALLGIPVYLSSEGSLPMVASLLDGGMGAGPALAFLVTGAGTSIGAISGLLVIARWRVVALVVGCLFVGALALGWLAPLWL